MDKRKEMMVKDTFLAHTIFQFTNDIDKAYEIFVALYNQNSWRVSDIESRL